MSIFTLEGLTLSVWRQRQAASWSSRPYAMTFSSFRMRVIVLQGLHSQNAVSLPIEAWRILTIPVSCATHFYTFKCQSHRGVERWPSTAMAVNGLVNHLVHCFRLLENIHLRENSVLLYTSHLRSVFLFSWGSELVSGDDLLVG